MDRDSAYLLSSIASLLPGLVKEDGEEKEEIAELEHCKAGGVEMVHHWIRREHLACCFRC